MFADTPKTPVTSVTYKDSKYGDKGEAQTSANFGDNTK